MSRSERIAYVDALISAMGFGDVVGRGFARRVGARPGRNEEREERNLIDGVAQIEAAEASIDAFIERRARGNAAENAREELWKASVRRHHNKLRTERLWARLGWHQAQLERHTATFEELMRRHRVGIRLVEEALGITSDEERKPA